MKRLFFGLIVLSGLSFQACNQVPDNPVGPVNILPKTASIVQADNELGFELFDILSDELLADENIFISPVSINLALGMARNGARTNTLQAMEEVMHVDGLSSTEINQTFQSLIQDLSNLDNQVTLNIANSVWYDQNFIVEPQFISDNQTYFDAEVTPLDFSDGQSVAIINNWVSDKTNEKITSIISNLSPYDRMVLINAIYFKGIWKYKFNEDDTYEGQFRLENNTTSPCHYMRMKVDAETMSNDWVNGLKLPYGNESYNMYVLVPQDNVSIQEVINQLDAAAWEDWCDGFSVQPELNIHFPRFSFEYEHSLSQSLKDLGMSVAFTDQADFSAISPEAVYISDVLHKSFVEVNEEGTEAAAVTAIVFETTSVGPDNTFFANKAFLFMIQEKQTGAILFMGKVGKPE